MWWIERRKKRKRPGIKSGVQVLVQEREEPRVLMSPALYSLAPERVEPRGPN
jgi:hypothetical protein